MANKRIKLPGGPFTDWTGRFLDYINPYKLRAFITKAHQNKRAEMYKTIPEMDKLMRPINQARSKIAKSIAKWEAKIVDVGKADDPGKAAEANTRAKSTIEELKAKDAQLAQQRSALRSKQREAEKFLRDNDPIVEQYTLIKKEAEEWIAFYQGYLEQADEMLNFKQYALQHPEAKAPQWFRDAFKAEHKRHGLLGPKHRGEQIPPEAE